jgi:hypothetical protein
VGRDEEPHTWSVRLEWVGMRNLTRGVGRDEEPRFRTFWRRFEGSQKGGPRHRLNQQVDSFFLGYLPARAPMGSLHALLTAAWSRTAFTSFSCSLCSAIAFVQNDISLEE